MTAALPRDIVKRLERRWTAARANQAETFHEKAECLKQNTTPVPESAQPPTEKAEQTDLGEISPQT